MNQNLLQLRNAILAVAEAHADLAVAISEGDENRDYKYRALSDATYELDEALEFLSEQNHG